MGKDGTLRIPFNREVVFPAELVSQFNAGYVEEVPEFKLDEEQLALIEAAYQQY